MSAQDLQDDTVFTDADDFGGGSPTESTVFHIAGDPKGVPRHVDAVWNTPATITN